MDVAIYTRVSTEKQDASAPSQLAACKRFCAAQGWNVRESFSEQASGGDSPFQRPELMRAMATQLPVVVFSQSRIARDERHFYALVNDAHFVNIEDGPKRVEPGLLVGVRASMDAEYKRQCSRRSTAQWERMRSEGKRAGRASTGYKMKNGVERRDGSKLLSTLAQLTDAGLSRAAIAAALEDAGFVNGKGRRFGGTQIVRMQAKMVAS